MNQLHPEWKDFLELLGSEKVDFVIVGGLAVAFHGRPRFTGDIDVFVRADKSNAERIMKVVERFGFGSVGLKSDDFAAEGFTIQFGREPRRIDILTSITGVAFEAAYASKEIGTIDGLKVPFISRELLIKNKKETARHKDLGDVDTLERTRSRTKAKK